MKGAAMSVGRASSLMIGLLVIVSPLISMNAASTAAAYTSNTASWTVMVYMAADMADSLPWELDINEMEAAALADSTNVIALVDPPGASDAMLLKIEHDENLMNSEIISTTVDDQGAVIPGEGDVNTGSSTTLRDFVVFSATEFPADNLVLVLWGHGSGWRGICPDDNDPLTLPELRSALAMAEETLQRGLNLVVLDVCNGATMELAYEIHDYADLLVGSELSVPAEGLPYMEVLDALAAVPSQSVEDFGRSVVESYVEWAEYGSAQPTAACMLDLRTMEELIGRLDSTSEIGLRFDRLYHPSLVSAAHSSEHTDDEWSMDFGALSVELCADGLPLEMRTAALEMALEYASAVTYYAECNMELRQYGISTGLSLYSPSDDDTDDGYSDLRISATSWTNLSSKLHNDSTAQDNTPGPLMTTEDSVEDDDDLPDSVTLVWGIDDTWNYTSYEVHVYRLEPHGLVDCQAIQSVDQEVYVSGIVGSLLMSASASVGDEVYSHHVLNTTLFKQVRLDLTVGDGAIAYEGTVDVVLTSQSHDSKRVECRNGSCTEWISVPEWADVGELITLQVVDTESGAVLSEATMRVTGEDSTVALNVHRPDEETTAVGILIGLFAIVVMLMASVAVHVRQLRRK